MSRWETLRASDADREQVTGRLRRAATEGRLDADELEDRLGAALAARTYGELDALLADLPAAGVTRFSASPDSSPAKRRPRLAVPHAATATIALLVALLAAFLLMAIAASQVRVSQPALRVAHPQQLGLPPATGAPPANATPAGR